MPPARPLPPAFVTAFADLADRRVKRSQRYPLPILLFMALCAVLSDAKGWDQIAAFGRRKKSWFSQFFEFPKRTPCADTFRRTFERLGPKVLAERFPRWLQAWQQQVAEQVIAFDGKAVKSTFDASCPTEPLHLLHAFATQAGLLLGMKRVAGAPGEVAGILEMLQELDLAGSVITADANGCTQAIAAHVIEAKADYALALKGNRGPIFAQTKALFAQALADADPDLTRVDDHDKGHGRREQRITHVLPAERLPASLRDK